MQKLVATATALAFMATPAFAHLSPEAHGSLLAGFTHPLFGTDHVLAMVTVGLWSAMLGGRALWLVPAAFVGTMTLGYGLALGGISLPFVEPTILASVIVLGLLVAVAAPVPVGVGAGLVAAFALFHGHAHGGELGTAGALGYGLGFVAATAALHILGAVLGLALLRQLGAKVGSVGGRIAGAAAAAGGVALAMAG